MPVVIRLKGRVLPEHTRLTITNLPAIDFREEPYPPELPNGLAIHYEITVDHGGIDMCCHLDSFSDSLLSWIYNRALRIARVVIDLYSFGTGVPLSVTLDRFIDPDGNSTRIVGTNPHLQGLCPTLQVDPGNPGALNFGPLFELVLKDTDVAFAIRDLVSAISDVDASTVDCARAIDGLRHIMWPHDDKGKGWELLRAALNLSEDYLNFIMDASKKLRHGNREYIPGSIISEVTMRSWTVMNRFLEYRLRANKRLPEDEFPPL